MRTTAQPREIPYGWNATDDEWERAWPCDALLPDADTVFVRGIDVAAPVAVVYRRLCHLRRAPYSYDWADNFGLPSPRRRIPGIENLAVGQRAMHLFRIVAFERDASITLRLTAGMGRALMGDLAGTYDVRANGATTRLSMKVLRTAPRGVVGSATRTAYDWIDYAMSRKQLERLRDFAEHDARNANTTALCS